MLHTVAAYAALHRPLVSGQPQLRIRSQLRSPAALGWPPLRLRHAWPRMDAREEAHAHGAASVDELVDELSALVATHERSPLQLQQLHSSLQAVTARCAAALGPEAVSPAKLTVAELRVRLSALGLSTSGLKADLVARLAAATEQLSTLESAAARPTETGEADSAVVDDPVLRRQLEEVERKFAGSGPQTGIFTDGSCIPNPGPGGWGVVAVHDGRVLWTERHSEADTTNNRMEMSAIIHALRAVGEGEEHTIYSDWPLWCKTPSVRPEDCVLSASLDHPKAQGSPSHPGAPPQRLGGLPWPQAPRLYSRRSGGLCHFPPPGLKPLRQDAQ